MDIDTLIFLLIFVGAVISQIRKAVVGSRKKGTDKAKASAKEPGWQKALKQIISRIQEELNPEIKMSPKDGASLWGSIIGERVTAQKGDEPEARDPSEIIDAEPEVLESRHFIKTEQLIKKEAKPQGTDLKIRDEGTKEKGEFNVKDLRRAVVWSEILAPPVALRGD